jgi:hypothetical protein
VELLKNREEEVMKKVGIILAFCALQVCKNLEFG